MKLRGDKILFADHRGKFPGMSGGCERVLGGGHGITVHIVEVAAIIDAIYHVENVPPTITKLMAFFNKAADADGCTLLNTLN